MELRSGYKQTEVGVIPEDWECVESGAMATYFGGNAFKSEAAVSDGVRWLKIANVGKQRAQWTDVSYLPHSYATDFKGYMLREGDVVVALTRPILDNELKIAKLTELDVPSLLNQRVAKVIARPGADLDFIYYVLQTRHFVDSMNETMAGTDPPNIGSRALERIPIAAPPTVDEQRGIARALSDVDALIGALDQLIAKKRDLKQAAMQQLLTGQTRLPGFSGEWEVKRLGDVAHIKTGSKNNEDKVEDGAYPLFVRSQTVERINSYSYDCEAILIPGEGGIGSIFHYISGKFDCHQRVYKISAFNADTSGKFIFYCMKNSFHKQATRNSVKATVDSLRLPTFLEFEFAAPSREEQTAIAAVLSDIDSELAVLEARLAKTRALKQGMMQELLTGRTRLV